MNSQFLYPSPALSGYIKYYWILNSGVPHPQVIQTIPTGCMHLVFHRGTKLSLSPEKIQPAHFIRGQISTPGNLTSTGVIDMIAVIFHPLGMNPFFSFPMDKMYNEYTDIDALEDEGLKHLKAQVANEENPLICVQHIETFLQKRLKRAPFNYKRIENSIALIKNSPVIDISTLADRACLGYRHYKREFENYTGMNPKEYIKVIRFQRVLYMLQQAPQTAITQLAYDCGYYDHSHLIKDFKAFSGYSPTKYLSTRVPYSTFFSNDCQLNLVRK